MDLNKEFKTSKEALSYAIDMGCTHYNNEATPNILYEGSTGKVTHRLKYEGGMFHWTTC